MLEQARAEQARQQVSGRLVIAPHAVGLVGALFFGLGFMPVMLISQAGLFLGMGYIWRTRALLPDGVRADEGADA